MQTLCLQKHSGRALIIADPAAGNAKETRTVGSGRRRAGWNGSVARRRFQAGAIKGGKSMTAAQIGTEIHRALHTALHYAALSDEFWHRGEPLVAAQFYRLSEIWHATAAGRLDEGLQRCRSM
jgi:hypothetical protein